MGPGPLVLLQWPPFRNRLPFPATGAGPILIQNTKEALENILSHIQKYPWVFMKVEYAIAELYKDLKKKFKKIFNCMLGKLPTLKKILMKPGLATQDLLQSV